MRTRRQAADPTALDLPYLATTYGIPEDDIQAIIDAPNADIVKTFLASLTTKAHEYDDLKAEKLQVDVELENTVRTSETKAKAQKATVTRNAKEIEELRTKLNEAESARETLATELAQLKTSTSGSTAETQALRQRIETLEASNRDTLALVESKTTEKDRLATELSEQHSKLISLRREVGQLEEKNQSLENAASSQKFREQSLQQEIDLLKKSNDWSSNELQTRSQEHAKFRKERNARIATLQRELEDENANVEALKRTETTLRQRLEEAQAKTDEAFAQIASLQDDFAKKEQDYRTQIDSTKRLADLQAQNANTHKARLQDVQSQIDQLKDEAGEEIGKLQAEIETERSDKEEVERKLVELEQKIEELEQQPRALPPATPVRNGALEVSTPSRYGSPAVPGSVIKGARALTHTQLYDQFIRTKQALTAEERRCSRLQTALDGMLLDMERQLPAMNEAQADRDRLEQEMLNFSHLLDESNEGRETAHKESKRWQSEADAATREGHILRQQLRDLAAQIKMLVVEAAFREQGLGEMPAQERLDLERAARGELLDGDLDDLSSTGRLISERLVIFRDVSELQARNQDLLRVTRQLGEQMEGQEAQEKARQSASDAAEVEELRQQVGRYKDELNATATQIDSYMKERDMFRRMLQYRGTIQPDADLQSIFGQSVVPSTPQRNGGPGMVPPTPRSKDVEDLNKLLKEQQAFFDSYRTESATDRKQLKDQVDTLAREKSSLQADVAKAHSDYNLAASRYEMLNGNYTALRTENEQLQIRTRTAYENATKQDMRTQQVAEELVEARSMTESLRHENANIKAEKELWKRIETRLTEDNKGLMDERSRLNKLVADLQNMQNERELAESESKRRLQGRIDGLETEVADSKKKLEHEVEESRKMSLRREYEENQNRTRIDDLVKSLGNVREELVAAKTTRDQLQTRVDEMKIELRSAEEKVVALQPRPTPRAENNGEQQTNGEDELPAEQRLAIEVSELRRDLELARGELESAHEQVEQYKSIAQSTEEELASFNETSVAYREENDRLIAEKEARVTELEQRIEDLSSELTTSNNELSELRIEHEDSSRVLNEQKTAYEAELARLRDDADRHGEEKKLIHEDLKAQAEIAQQAQQSYENELVKHAEATSSLQNIRKEYNELRTEVAGIRAEAEAAKASLENGEESWNEQKERFEQEINDMRSRRADVDEQNKLLHQQMESFSSELQALRQNRNTSSSSSTEEAAGSPARGDSNLQEVIKFIRREKEILDVQYELSVQESKRLQQTLDHVTHQLDETRQKLVEERSQTTERSAQEHRFSELSKKLEETNIIRESNTTLRFERDQLRDQLETKTRDFERLVAEMEPLQGRINELEGEMESKEGERKLLEDDRNHWRERTQNIISKYDRVDPAELEELRNQLAELKAEKERLEAEQAPLQEQVDGFEARIATEREDAAKALTDRLERFKEQAKEQNRKQNTRLLELKAGAEAATKEQERLSGELEGVKGELEEVKTARDEAVKKAEGEKAVEGEGHAEMHARIAEAERVAGEHAGRAEELYARVQELEAQVANLQSEVETAQAASGVAGSDEASQARVQELEEQVSTLQTQLETAEAGEVAETDSARVQELEGQVEVLQGELTAAKAAVAANDEDEGEITEPSADQQALQTLRVELATAKREVETLRANASSSSIIAPSDNNQDLASQVTAEVEKLKAEMEAQHQVAIKQIEENADKKISTAKSNLSRQLREEREKMRTELTAEIRQSIVAEHEVDIQNLKTEHEAAITKLKEEHTVEMEKLKASGAAAVAKAQQNGTTSDVKTETTATPAASAADLLTFSDDQAMELLKTNAKMRAIFTNNLKKGVAKEAESMKAEVAEKDEEVKRKVAEITKLTAELATAQDAVIASATRNPSQPQPNTARVAELEAKLAAAQAEKETAVAKAVSAAEMKVKVQISQRDIAQAKIAAVQKAAAETPEKPVAEVWEVASKAKPVPKAAPAAAAGPGAGTPAKPLESGGAAGVGGGAAGTGTDQAKLQARQERFGTPSAPSPVANATPATFGQPSQQPSFGQPSQSTFGQPSRGPGTPPNPAAASFTPAAAATRGSGIPAPSGSRIARGGASGIARGGGAQQQGVSIQGAAAGGAGAGGRGGGGQQSGIARGGQQAGRGGGGRGGRGGPQGQGLKRTFDGPPGQGGDEKRQRGGGGGSA